MINLILRAVNYFNYYIPRQYNFAQYNIKRQKGPFGTQKGLFRGLKGSGFRRNIAAVGIIGGLP
jgi:hypothetical protein